MKTKLISLILLLTITATLSLTACGTTEQQALSVISDIPLPSVGYSVSTGHKLILTEPEAEILSYDASTGKPNFMISCTAQDSSWWTRLWENDTYRIYFITLPSLKPGNWFLYFNCGLQEEDIWIFTLAELKELHDELVWK